MGIVNHLAKRGVIQNGSELFGKAFENYIFHEINVHRKYSELFYDIFYWRTTSGIEVDFILNDMECAIEVKSSKSVNSNHLRGLRALTQDFPKIKRRIIVSQDETYRNTEDGIEIIPYRQFLKMLWRNEILN